MTTTANGGTTDEASALENELTHRLLASAAGLSRVCALKRCRRRKRCLAVSGRATSRASPTTAGSCARAFKAP